MRRLWSVDVIILLCQAVNTSTTVPTTTHTDGALGLKHACKFSSDGKQLIRKNRALDGLYYVDMATLEKFKIVTRRWKQGDSKLTYSFEVGSSVPSDKQVDVGAIKFHFTEEFKSEDDKHRRLTRKNILVKYIGAYSGHITKLTSHLRRDEQNEKVIFWGFRKLI